MNDKYYVQLEIEDNEVVSSLISDRFNFVFNPEGDESAIQYSTKLPDGTEFNFFITIKNNN